MHLHHWESLWHQLRQALQPHHKLGLEEPEAPLNGRSDRMSLLSMGWV